MMTRRTVFSPRTISSPRRDARARPFSLSLLLAVVPAALLLPACDGRGGLLRPPEEEWVAMEPVQCLGNPWERDWIERHGNDPQRYPRDRDSVNRIIADYYGRLGVEVRAVVSLPRYDVVCLACSCPRGDTLYLLVDDARPMLDLGFRREFPGWPGG